MADLEGGFSNRVSAILISSAFILAILGWAFALGVSYSDITDLTTEVDRLRGDTNRITNELSEQSERVARAEVLLGSMDQTLKEIRDDLRQNRPAGQ